MRIIHSRLKKHRKAGGYRLFDQGAAAVTVSHIDAMPSSRSFAVTLTNGRVVGVSDISLQGLGGLHLRDMNPPQRNAIEQIRKDMKP